MPYHSPQKGNKSRKVEGTIITSNLKTSIPCKLPTNFIWAKPLHCRRINQPHKLVKGFFFPILWWTTKLHIPVKPPRRPTHNFSHQAILRPTKAIKLRKGLLESTIPTPHMLPKFHSSLIPHIINKEFREVQLATSNISPQADPIRTCHLFRTPTTPNVPIFCLYNPPP